MKNSQRLMVKIIREICAQENISCETFSHDWVLRLSKNGKTAHIFGYQFDNNSAGTQLICTDKCATYELLKSLAIPAVEHHFFICPEDFQYIEGSGNWPGMLGLLNEYHRLVVKPNEGTGGKEIYLASSPAELEAAVSRIFLRNRSIAISPLLPIASEYRVILLNEQEKLVYSKKIPVITGDGVTTVRNLVLNFLQQHPEVVIELSMDEEISHKILPKGEKMPLTWKHNLGQGSLPEIVNTSDLKDQLVQLAKKAASAVNGRFVSVDIIEQKNTLMVLEINSGIMMEAFAQQDPSFYILTKEIYRDAIRSLGLS